jgi:CRP-like cAMP-binding protein
MTHLVERTTLLEKSMLFVEVETSDIDEVLAIGREVEFKPDEVIVEEGDYADGMFIVLDGQAQVDIGGRFHRLRVGDFFGEMALLGPGGRLATVRAVQPLRALKIPSEGFQSFLLEHPKVAVKMLKTLVARLREVEQRIDAWIAS